MSTRFPGRRELVAVVIVLLTAVPFLAGTRGASAAAPPAATFNPNLLLAGSAGAAEPSIRTDHTGQAFVIGPTGAQCQAFRVSHDGSHAQSIGAPDHKVGGGDCDWALGPQETASLPTFGAPSDNALAFSSLDNLANITVGKSNDGGKTFGPPNPAAAQVGGDDRMWMAADPKLNSSGYATIFMTFHDISLGDIELSISTDGGQTYLQSGPIINPTDVPQGQWEGLGAFAGNELGNIVARRNAAGQLTLYSIFETPDSATDNVTQGANSTTNFNRVYEAVGTVTDAAAPAPPTISWRNYEIYHGPLGARLNRIFPVTAVDAGGRVYSFWADGNHIYDKTDATGTGWNPLLAPGTIPNPSGVNTAIMPWVEAGVSGIADLVYYGASGGAGAQPNPQDDPNNKWNVYMAQTVDGGASWGVFTASDHVIHTGPLCIDGLNCNLIGNRDRTLLDFFQVAIDPTNGAADITYADDHASPHSAVLYYTRQCTGASATTGQALVNDCVAPPPPPPLPQGSTCPGPQVVDFVGDAPNNYPGGDGANMDNLDIVSAAFGTPSASALSVTLTLNNLSAPPPPVNMISAYWTVYWTDNGVTYYARATSNTQLDFTYTDGTVSGGTATTKSTITGVATLGKNGTFVISVPRADVGSPPAGAALTNPYADTHGSFTVNGTGVFFTAAADRAPNQGYGAPYTVAQVCSTPPPCHEADGNGDLHGQKEGNAKFNTESDGCEDGGATAGAATTGGGAQFQDPGSHVNFQSAQVLSTRINDATHTLILTGTGTDNGNPVTFTITEVNKGAIGLDSFSIALSDGYSLSGTLLDGTLDF